MERDIAKEKFYAAKKRITIFGVNVDTLVISKLVKAKTRSKYLIGIKFDKAIRPLVLITPKMSGYVKTFKSWNKINILIILIDDMKLLEKYKAIWTKIEDLKNIKLKILSVYNDRYKKPKIRTYGDKVYTNIRGLNAQEDV